MTNLKHLIDSSGPKDIFQASLGRSQLAGNQPVDYLQAQLRS